jgi:hypothetical protein
VPLGPVLKGGACGARAGHIEGDIFVFFSLASPLISIRCVASLPSCNRVSKSFIFNTRFHPEINKEWEKFFTFLRKEFGTFG